MDQGKYETRWVNRVRRISIKLFPGGNYKSILKYVFFNHQSLCTNGYILTYHNWTAPNIFKCDCPGHIYKPTSRLIKMLLRSQLHNFHYHIQYLSIKLPYIIEILPQMGCKKKTKQKSAEDEQYSVPVISVWFEKHWVNCITNCAHVSMETQLVALSCSTFFFLIILCCFVISQVISVKLTPPFPHFACKGKHFCIKSPITSCISQVFYFPFLHQCSLNWRL